jgi:sugar phosphate isomerase/epimerase
MGEPMNDALSVSAFSTIQLSLDDDLRFWSSAGITNVGLSWQKLEAAGPHAAVRVRDAGLRVTSLFTRGFPLDQPHEWPTHEYRLQTALEAAISLDAECLAITTGCAGAMTWEAAADAFAAATEPVIASCRAAGIPLAVEHTNSLRVDVGFLHSLRDAVDLTRVLGVGVVMECDACWAERDLAHTIDAGIDVILLVQVSDYAIGSLSTPDRCVPGDGDIPLARIVGRLLGAGYAGVFELEVVGPRIEAEGYASAIPRAVNAMEAMLADAQARV